MFGGRVAADGQELSFSQKGQRWAVSWHPPACVPAGRPHGANALCVTGDGHVVLISSDERHWGWPGGRPEDGEDWQQTLRRKVLEEACAEVAHARLLGFTRSACLHRPEQDLVLVRSLWRAEVRLLGWNPEPGIPHRREVPAAELRDHLWMEEGLEPIYRRALLEAGLA
jgi:ADP-ribose pyrophosphatase YjhB (NUDIX family)